MKVSSQIGLSGEELAAKFLQSQGYKIIERNFSKRYGEIDIVALEKDVLVFVEVKTRRSLQFGSPLLTSPVRNSYHELATKQIPS